MAKMGQVFSTAIFFIIFREVIEASIIIAVLLSLVENLVEKEAAKNSSEFVAEGEETTDAKKRRLVRRMRIQIWAGACLGLFIALCIGAAFIAVFFTTLNDIWSASEEIWEGVFSLIACIIIFVMGVTMLRIDRSKLKWQHKLEGAFDKKVEAGESSKERAEGKSGKWTLFLLPMITVLREGLEAVVFVGGVSLGQSAKSIPLAAIVGIICGAIVGYLIYISGSKLNLSIFLVISTNILFLLGAGLFSKSVGDFERYKYNKGSGGDAAEAGAGPGSYDIRNSIWHVDYGNPENSAQADGWSVFNAILGWSNDGSYGTVLSYIFYWLAVVVALFWMKWSEGRMSFFGKKSAAAHRREARAANRAAGLTASGEKIPSRDGSEDEMKRTPSQEHDRQI